MGQLMEKQRTARTLGTMECACPDSTCLDSSSCVHTTSQPNRPCPRETGEEHACFTTGTSTRVAIRYEEGITDLN